jgi:ABC-2 type transport system permease protein
MPEMSADPSVSAPLVLLFRLHALQAWRRVKSVREQSPLLVGLIVFFLGGYLALSFGLFYKGLTFVAAFPGLGTVLTERLLYLLFAFLFVLLLLSNLIISYTNLFRNREAGFLMSLPVPAQTIFRWKFFESTLLASWAFLLMIAPLLAAFGLTRGVPWHFYPVTLVLIALFIILPGVAGSWAAITLARHLDRRAFQVAAVVLALGGLIAAAFFWKSQAATDEMLETRVLAALDLLLQRTRFAQFQFLPSYWLSAGVLQWAEGAVAAAVFFMLVLLSNVSFFGFLAFTRLGNAYYAAASNVQSRARRRRAKNFAYHPGLAEKIFRALWWVDRDIRALLVKDARIFWRDTAQWGQTVLIFGLLGVYIINLRHFTSQLTSHFWIHLVSYLNLFACSLNLATVTTRFVYPQFSLEGARLWIVGLAPMGLPRVVKAKCWLASFASLLVTLTLITLSCYLLNMTWDRIVFFGCVMIVMTFTLNGLAAGLGVLYPNFKENNPNKIVSGFGGTFCLVLSFVYILGSVLVLAFGSSELRRRGPVQAPAIASLCAFLAFSVLVGWLPLRLGLRRLKTLEF